MFHVYCTCVGSEDRFPVGRVHLSARLLLEPASFQAELCQDWLCEIDRYLLRHITVYGSVFPHANAIQHKQGLYNPIQMRMLCSNTLATLLRELTYAQQTTPEKFRLPENLWNETMIAEGSLSGRVSSQLVFTATYLRLNHWQQAVLLLDWRESLHVLRQAAFDAQCAHGGTTGATGETDSPAPASLEEYP